MIWDDFVRRAEAWSDRPAVLTDDERWTYSELFERVERASPASSGRGRTLIEPGSPLEVLVSVLAAWRRGETPVLVRTGTRPAAVDELARLLQRSAGGPPPGEALVMCTSGSTGRPKPVSIPDRSLRLNLTTIADALELGPGDRVAVSTPLTFSYGLIGSSLAALWSGATCRLFEPTAPQPQLIAAIRRERLTVVQGPPALLRLLLGYWNGGEPFEAVQTVTTGGEPLARSLVELLGAAFPAARRLFLYGMTEAGPRISHVSFDEGGGLDNRIGHPYDHIEWRLTPVEGLPATVGRLALRGPGLMLGYVTDVGLAGVDDDGWFLSNDLLQRRNDGGLRFHGRVDRIFRSGGHLVSPEGVELALNRHRDVADARCRPEPHDVLGLVPVADVVAAPGRTIDAPSLRRHCRELVDRHAVPRRIEVMESFGVAASGKRASR